MARVRETAFFTRMRRPRPSTVAGAGLCALIALLALYPVSLMLWNSFQLSAPGDPATYGLEGWRALTKPYILEAFYNTLLLVLARQLISLPLAIVLAWLIARTDLPGRNFFEFMFLVSFLLPALPVTLGWILLLDPRFGLVNQMLLKLPFIHGPLFNIFSFWGIVWVHLSLYTLSIKVLLLTAALRNMDATLEEASRMCGGSPVRTLRFIDVPLIMPTILVVLILSTIRSLEAFEVEIMLGLPRRLYVYSTMIYDLVRWEPPQYPPAMALGAVFLLMLAAMVALAQWYTGRHQYRTVGGQGFRVGSLPLGRWKWPIFAFVLTLVVVFAVVPVIFLLLASFMRVFGFFAVEDAWTFVHWRKVLSDPVFLNSLTNAIILMLSAAVGTLLLSVAVAYVAARTSFAGRRTLDFLAWLPWGIPGILLGLAMIWILLGNRVLAPVYGTILALILAVTIKELPMGSQLLKGAMLQLGMELEESSRMAGGRWLYTFRRIVMPIVLPTTLAVLIVVMISAARDTSTVALLSTSENRPLSILMLDYLVESKEYERAAVVGAIITLLVLITAFVVRKLGFRLSIHA